MGLSPEERRKRHAEATAERDAAYTASGPTKRPKGRAPKDKIWDEIVGGWIPIGSATSQVSTYNHVEAEAADVSLHLGVQLRTGAKPNSVCNGASG